MILTSSIYLTFLVILLFLYYIFPKKMQWLLLLLFSFIFIAFSTSDVKVYLYILYTVLVSYVGSNIIGDAKNEKQKKRIQSITVILLFIQLVFLKYLNFVGSSSINFINLFGVNLSWTNLSIIAPIGVTFYTLIAIGYVIDVGRGVSKPQLNILKHALYVLYFPQLTSGPFTRYMDMEKTLYSKHKFEFKNVCFGFQRIIWGFFKKLVISERMAIMVNTVFDNYSEFPGIYIVIATIAFAIQLYTDFSGCMDIVIGSSETLGVTLPENFDTPYFSKSISEYWRRWHITLGTWFKDYFFYPILKSNIFQNLQSKLKKVFGKKWGKKLTTYCGMFILWFTVGLWHGGATKYIIGSGLLHWFYIVSGEVLEPVFNKIVKILHINKENFLFKFWQIVRTFILVCIGDLFFRSTSTADAINMIKSLGVNNYTEIFKGALLNLGLDFKDLAIAISGILSLLTISLLKEKYKIREEIKEKNIGYRYAIWISLIVFVLIFGYYGTGYDAASFIYQNF